LNELGHTNILVVDKLGSSPTKWKNLRDCQFADYMEYDEFCGNKGWKEGLKGVTTVLHLGAKSATTEKDAAFLMDNNYGFSQWLSDWCVENGARFIYASSAATYGADTAMDDTAPITNLKPLNAYGYSKLLFDLWMTRKGRLESGAVGLKYTNIMGRGEAHKDDMRSVVCKAYDSLREGRAIELFESANPAIKTSDIRRDLLSVEDAAKITVWFALDPEGRKGAGLFNVGSGESTSFADLATYTAEAYCANHTPPLILPPSDPWALIQRDTTFLQFPYITYVPMPEHLRSRYQYVTCASIAKLRAAGYTEEFTPLKQAVSEYVEWMAKEDGV